MWIKSTWLGACTFWNEHKLLNNPSNLYSETRQINTLEFLSLTRMQVVSVSLEKQMWSYFQSVSICVLAPHIYLYWCLFHSPLQMHGVDIFRFLAPYTERIIKPKLDQSKGPKEFPASFDSENQLKISFTSTVHWAFSYSEPLENGSLSFTAVKKEVIQGSPLQWHKHETFLTSCQTSIVGEICCVSVS